MLTNIKPTPKQLNPISLGDIICNENDGNDIYVIEEQLQRPYVWNATNIDAQLTDVFTSIDINLSSPNSSKRFDSSYVDLGNADLSVPDERVYDLLGIPRENTSLQLHSIVDASQRIRTALFTDVAFNIIITFLEGNTEYIDFNMEYESNKEGIPKVNEISHNDNVGRLYEWVQSTSVKKIVKEAITKPNSHIYAENKVKPLDMVVNYIIYAINNEYNFYNCDEDEKNKWIDKMKKIRKIHRNNCFIHFERVSKNNKSKRFIDCNGKGTPIEKYVMVEKYLTNHLNDEKTCQRLDEKFNIFRDKAMECEKNGLFRETKNHENCIAYIMKESYKILLYLKNLNNGKTLKSSFAFDDPKLGVNILADRKETFKNESEITEYYEICNDFADFILNKSMSYYDDNYMFLNYARGTQKKPQCIWWYFLTPLYLINRYKGSFWENVKDMLYRKVYILYSIRREATGSSNSQTTIDFLSDISRFIVESERDNLTDIIKQQHLNEMLEQYISNIVVGSSKIKNLSKEEIMHLVDDFYINLTQLRYKRNCENTPLKCIFIAMEYDAVKKFGVNKSALYKECVSVNQSDRLQLDHWYTLTSMIENNLEENSRNIILNRLGNLVLIEPGLNRNKGAISLKNAKTYSQSQIIATYLMDKDNIGSDLLKEKREDYINYIGMNRYSIDELNNPTPEMIDNRTKNLINFIFKFIDSPFLFNNCRRVNNI